MGDRGNSIRWLLAVSALARCEAALAADEPVSSAAGTDHEHQTAIGPGQSLREIVVFGQREDGSIEGVAPHDELDEDDIEAYGLDTVGDVIDELSANVRNGDTPPVILINGEEASGLADVVDLPPEALKRIQLLPPDAAVRYGQPKTRPVVNVVLKKRFRQVTTSVEADEATAGGARQAKGELTWTSIAGPSRNNVSIKVRGADPLLETERDIATAVDVGTPLSFSGIVLPRPLFAPEIDPALSALVGHPVTQADVPAGTLTPTLTDFVATADVATPGDLGRYRTLLPRTRGISLNAIFSRRLSPRLTAQFYARGDYSTSLSLDGASEGLFALPASSPFSPFTQTVTVARYFGNPLEQRHRSGNVSLGGMLGRQAGQWRFTLAMDWTHGESRSQSDRGIDAAALQAAISNGAANPFAPLPDSLISTMRADSGRGRRDAVSGNFMGNGPLFSLPAGAVIGALRVSGNLERSFSHSILSNIPYTNRTRRDEAAGQIGMDVPLFAAGSAAAWPLGDLTLTLSASARAISQARTYTGYGYGLRWSPFEALVIEGGFDSEQIPPSLQILTDPLVVRDNVRVFDFLHGETVEVRYLTGGNPAIDTERRNTLSLGGTLVLAARGGLVLNAAWTRQRSSDAVSALPPVSAEVQAAFPDRYRRDASGRLVEVDARAVSFAHVEREEFTWGFTLRRHLGGGGGTAPDEGSGDEGENGEARAGLRKGVGGVRLSASLQHTWTLKAARQARLGLPVVDLLEGGAIGYGGGQPRHRIEFGTGIAGGGIGLQVKGTYMGVSQIHAATTPQPGDLRFSARTVVEARLYADLGRLLSSSPVAKGLRVSLTADNLFDSKAIVRDRSGLTPFGYQPYLVDPQGRTVTIALRKKF